MKGRLGRFRNGVIISLSLSTVETDGAQGLFRYGGPLNDNEGPEGPSLCYLTEMVYQRWLDCCWGRLLKQSLQ